MRRTTLYPARLLGPDGETSQLSAGSRANMWLLDNDFIVLATRQGGVWHEGVG